METDTDDAVDMLPVHYRDNTLAVLKAENEELRAELVELRKRRKISEKWLKDFKFLARVLWLTANVFAGIISILLFFLYLVKPTEVTLSRDIALFLFGMAVIHCFRNAYKWLFSS